MKPPVFAYRDPRELDEALGVLAEDGFDVAVLAGGQSLVPLLNMRLAQPGIVLDINRVADLDYLEVTPSVVSVGALTRAATVERHPEVAAALPVLVETVRHIAHPQIRNRTTIGGNIAHADPASELPGLLAVLDGQVDLASREGQRRLSWHEFFVAGFMTAREPEELVAAVHFPILAGARLDFREVARRHGDFPLAGLASGIRMQDGVITSARLAAVGVTDHPTRLTVSEAALVGVDPSDTQTVHEVVTAVRDDVNPTADIHASTSYRLAVLRHLMAEAVSACARTFDES